MFTIKDGRFYNLTKGSFTAIKAVQTKAGRWQYRDVDTNRLYASGMSPEVFVKEFWYGEYVQHV